MRSKRYAVSLSLILSSIGGGESGVFVFQITPQKPRKKKPQLDRTIIVTCQSKQLKAIMGKANFTVSVWYSANSRGIATLYYY